MHRAVPAAAASVGSTAAAAADASPGTVFDTWYAVARDFAAGATAASASAAHVVAATTRAVSTLFAPAHLLLDDAGGAAAADGHWRLDEAEVIAGRLAGIFESKPKFAAIAADATHGPAIVAAFYAAVGPVATRIIQAASTGAHGVDDSLTMAALGCLHAALRMERLAVPAVAAGVGAGVASGRASASIAWEALAALAFDGAASSVVREKAVSVLVAGAACDGGVARHVRTLAIARATDADACRALWPLGVAQDTTSLKQLVKRIAGERATAAVSGAAAVHSVAISVPAGGAGGVSDRRTLVPVPWQHVAEPQLVRDLVASLHESLLDLHASHAAGAASTAAAAAAPALQVLAAADAFQPVAPAPAPAGAGAGASALGITSLPPIATFPEAAGTAGTSEPLERCDEWLACASAVLAASASAPASADGGAGVSDAAVDLLLRAPTLATVTTLSGAAPSLPAQVWESRLLPWCERMLRSHMRALVTGSQEDQEVVNLLVQGLKTWYGTGTVAGVHHPTPALGRGLLQCVVLAMMRGYGDTERLPELAGHIMRRHHIDGSVSWLLDIIHAVGADHSYAGSPSLEAPAAVAGAARRSPTALLSSLVPGLSATCVRGLIDLLTLCLGVESGSSGYGVEETGGSTDVTPADAFVEDILVQVCRQRHALTDAFLLQLTELKPAALRAHPHAISALLNTLLADPALALDGSRPALSSSPLAAPQMRTGASVSVGAVVGSEVPAATAVWSRLRGASRLLLAVSAVASTSSTAPALAAGLTRIARAESAMLQRFGAAFSALDRDAIAADQQHAARALVPVLDAVAVPPELARQLDTPLTTQLPLPLDVVMDCYPLASDVGVRRSLARLLPLIMLRDSDHTVRMAALEELAHRVDYQRATLGTPLCTAATAIAALLAVPPDAVSADEALLLCGGSPALPALSSAVEDATHVPAYLPSVGGGSSAAPSSPAAFAPRLAAARVTQVGGASDDVLLRPGARRLYRPTDDSRMGEISLCRAALHVIAPLALAAIASVGSGSDPCATAASGTSMAAAHALAVATLSAAVGRLIRAAVVTAESDPRGEPDIAARAALDELALFCPPDVLQAYATSPAGLQRLSVLSELSQRWREVVAALSRARFIAPAMIIAPGDAPVIGVGPGMGPGMGPAADSGPDGTLWSPLPPHSLADAPPALHAGAAGPAMLYYTGPTPTSAVAAPTFAHVTAYPASAPPASPPSPAAAAAPTGDAPASRFRQMFATAASSLRGLSASSAGFSPLPASDAEEGVAAGTSRPTSVGRAGAASGSWLPVELSAGVRDWVASTRRRREARATDRESGSGVAPSTSAIATSGGSDSDADEDLQSVLLELTTMQTRNRDSARAVSRVAAATAAAPESPLLPTGDAPVIVTAAGARFTELPRIAAPTPGPQPTIALRSHPVAPAPAPAAAAAAVTAAATAAASVTATVVAAGSGASLLDLPAVPQHDVLVSAAAVAGGGAARGGSRLVGST